MKLFGYKDYEVVVDPVAWTLLPFRDILKKYKGKDKYYATLELAYIYYSVDWRSDYSTILNQSDKREKILNEIFIKDRNKLKLDSKTDVAIDFYKEKQATVSMGLYEDAKLAVNKIRDYFNAVDLTAMDDQGKPLHDISKLTKAISDTANIVSKLKELENIVKKEVEEASNYKGISEIGIFE